MSNVVSAAQPDASASRFHAGERAAQARAGVPDAYAQAAQRAIRDAMPEQHRTFFAAQPFIVLGGLDPTGQPWATLRTGEPGFVSSPDPRTLRIAGAEVAGDPLTHHWNAGALLGVLGIQPTTRRRNRANGVISAREGSVLTVDIRQSFGNCPRYIQARTPAYEPAGRAAAPAVDVSARLSTEDRALIATADTLFIATANNAPDAGPGRGADVSHRGGRAGFVRIDDDRTLTVPDFNGNGYFNTIGNLLEDPRAGLLFVDFATGDLLFVVADAQIVWEGPELHAHPGAERLMRLRITEARRSRHALPFRWSAREYAPQLVRAEG